VPRVGPRVIGVKEGSEALSRHQHCPRATRLAFHRCPSGIC